jgi:hypothetical protein
MLPLINLFFTIVTCWAAIRAAELCSAALGLSAEHTHSITVLVGLVAFYGSIMLLMKLERGELRAASAAALRTARGLGEAGGGEAVWKVFSR